MLPKSCSFDELSQKPKNVQFSDEKRLRKTHSEEGSDIFDYLDNGISRSISQFSGILKIAPKGESTEKPEENENEQLLTIKGRFLKFFKKSLRLRLQLIIFCFSSLIFILVTGKLAEIKEVEIREMSVFRCRIIPVMRTSSNPVGELENNNCSDKTEQKVDKIKNSGEMMESDEAVYEIDELNSTIAPSSSRQCIVGADLECAAPKPKKKAVIQRTDFHPKPPFSCVPIYTAILLGLLIVLIVGAVTTIVDMRPEFIYGKTDNETTVIHLLNDVEFSTLKPQ